MGILFALSVIGAVAAAIGIWRGERWGSQPGMLVAGGPSSAYFVTRTIGFPGFRKSTWEEFSEPSGVLSLVVEGMFVATAAWVLTARLASMARYGIVGGHQIAVGRAGQSGIRSRSVLRMEKAPGAALAPGAIQC